MGIYDSPAGFVGRSALTAFALPLVAGRDVINKGANTVNSFFGGSNDYFNTDATERYMNWAKNGVMSSSKKGPTYYGAQPQKALPQPALQPQKQSPALVDDSAAWKKAEEDDAAERAAYEAGKQKQQQNAPAPQVQPNMAFDPRGQLGMQMAGNQPMPDEYHAQRAGVLQKFNDASAPVSMSPKEASSAAWLQAHTSSKKALREMNPIMAANMASDTKGYEDRVNQRAQAMAGLKEQYGMYGNEYNTVNDAELKNREIAGKNYENLTQGANYDAEAANRRAALPFIGDKYKADIAGTNAQAGLHTAQGVLAGVQADAGRQTMGVQKSALEGNENALAMLGQEKNKALYAGLPKVVEGVTDPTEINNRTNAYISAALEAQRAARQGKVYRQTSPALPASGFGPWRQEARNATYSY